MEARDVVAIMTPALSCVFAIAFMYLWNLRRELNYILNLVLCNLCIITAFGSAWLIYPLSPFWSILSCGSFGLIASLPFAAAILNRLNRKTPFKTLSAIVFLSILSASFVLQDKGDITFAFACMTYAGGACMVVIAYSFSQVKTDNYLDKLVPVALVVFAVVLWGLPIFEYDNAGDGTILLNQYQDLKQWIVLNIILSVICTCNSLIMIMLSVADTVTALQKEADIDGLSGLSRKESFQNKVIKTLEQAARLPMPVSFIICDIDHFKNINDTFGHKVGDEVIRCVGAKLTSITRANDLVGRVGGEEFAVLLWGVNQNAASRVAEQLRQSLMKTDFSHLVEDMPVTVSFGVAEVQANETYDAVFVRADEALYRAKRSGRNKVEKAKFSYAKAS